MGDPSRPHAVGAGLSASDTGRLLGLRPRSNASSHLIGLRACHPDHQPCHRSTSIYCITNPTPFTSLPTPSCLALVAPPPQRPRMPSPTMHSGLTRNLALDHKGQQCLREGTTGPFATMIQPTRMTRRSATSRSRSLRQNYAKPRASPVETNRAG